MAKHIIITTEQNKQQRKENIEKYGTSKKILKHIRNNVRKLSKVNPSIKYTLDLEEYAKNLDYYIDLLNDNIYCEEIDSNFVEHLNRMHRRGTCQN